MLSLFTVYQVHMTKIKILTLLSNLIITDTRFIVFYFELMSFEVITYSLTIHYFEAFYSPLNLLLFWSEWTYRIFLSWDNLSVSVLKQRNIRCSQMHYSPPFLSFWRKTPPIFNFEVNYIVVLYFQNIFLPDVLFCIIPPHSLFQIQLSFVSSILIILSYFLYLSARELTYSPL